MRTPTLIGIFSLLSVSLSGCGVSLLAPYDQRTDEMVTEMQRAHARHVVTILDGQKPACLRSSNAGYYRDARIDAASLEMRASAIPKNKPTSDQIIALKNAIESFDMLDQLAEQRNACLSSAELSPIDRGMNQIFGAILKLELAKLRGGERPGF